ncbi:MAG: prepilin-type N-terminal cleavage/methylation domain-containing protein [Candidatus Methanomethylophilaceae archaeon]|jgi:type II secretory pathway pseudopilin PulG|nr:prepilin-type N-terminal cleavage/methylation domain-containing protein [Candidatus Methanomethylophilaceae archaeon]
MTIIPKILGQHPKLRREKTLPADAFTLLEIVVAMAIFFMAYFSIMELLNTNLRAARSLNVTQVDFTQVVYDMLATNRLEEISESGDFGDMYPGWSWTREAYEVSTNGFFQVDVEVYHPGSFGGRDSTTMSLWLYRPESILGR